MKDVKWCRTLLRIWLGASFLITVGLALGCSDNSRVCQTQDDCLFEESCQNNRCTSKSASNEEPSKGNNEGTSQTESNQSDASAETETSRPEPGPACSQDTDCPSNHACKSGACVPNSPPGCTTYTDCASGSQCKQGQCVPCQNECQPNSKRCNGQGWNACESYEGCFRWSPTTTPCPQGEKCQNGACVKTQGCQNDGDCDGKLSCKNGTCVFACTNDSICTPGYKCVAGLCVDRCNSDAQCQSQNGYSCVQGQCKQTKTPCKSDRDCSGTYICESGFCLTSCNKDEQCMSLHVCTQGQCVPSSSCASNNDCPSGYLCNNSKKRCETSCKESRGCQYSFVCDRTTWKCLPKPCQSEKDCLYNLACVQGRCKTKCTQHTDCNVGYSCEANKCVEGCKDNSNCGGYICDSRTKRCYSSCHNDKDCVGGKICYVSGRTRVCKSPCKSDSDCSSGKKCNMGHCAAVIKKVGAPCGPIYVCDTGMVCLNIASSGEYKVCLKACGGSSSCPTYHRCTYGLGKSSGPLGCFPRCSASYECSMRHKLPSTFACVNSLCRERFGGKVGGGTVNDFCRYDYECAGDHVCIKTSESNYFQKRCLRRCSPGGGCDSDQKCGVNEGRNPHSFPSSTKGCFYSCHTSRGKKCPANTSKVRYSCDDTGTGATYTCHTY